MRTHFDGSSRSCPAEDESSGMPLFDAPCREWSLPGSAFPTPRLAGRGTSGGPWAQRVRRYDDGIDCG